MSKFLTLMSTNWLIGFSQERNCSTNTNDSGIHICGYSGHKPVYKKGGNQFRLDVANLSKYPETALKESIEGKVFVHFIIDTLGQINNPFVIKGVRQDLNDEALRIIESLGNWIPATENGKKVSIKMSLPIYFKIN